MTEDFWYRVSIAACKMRKKLLPMAMIWVYEKKGTRELFKVLDLLLLALEPIGS